MENPNFTGIFAARSGTVDDAANPARQICLAREDCLQVGLGLLARIGQPGHPPGYSRIGKQVLHAIGALPGEMADMAERGDAAVLGILAPQGMQQANLQLAECAQTVGLGNAVGQTFAPRGRIKQKPVQVEDGAS
jgi:hypothetical protein